MSLGGIRDEAEIRGHRRTYIGALPGRLVRALRDAGTMNPVILLDEVDKLGADWRGDPSSALLEVLDPAQNSTFRDHYLDLEVDLSKVLFIATANVAEQIPAALLDRLEVIRLDGYTEDEKVAIAQRYLVPRGERRNGLRGGRGRDRGRGAPAHRHRVHARGRRPQRRAPDPEGAAQVRQEAGRGSRRTDHRRRRRPARAAGRPRPDRRLASATRSPVSRPGSRSRARGGDVLVVEATEMAGKGLTLTGQLGDVMSESATIALSLRALARRLLHDVDASVAEREVHVHVPAGAIPKDGPSAGVTMTVALVSLMSGRAVRADVGMTGEVTLQGRVLPVGGIKQKVLAAHRAGLTDVILPAPQRRRPGRAPRQRCARRCVPPRVHDRRGAVVRARAGQHAGTRSRVAHEQEDGRPDRSSVLFAFPERRSPACRAEPALGDPRSNRRRRADRRLHRPRPHGRGARGDVLSQVGCVRAGGHKAALVSKPSPIVKQLRQHQITAPLGPTG